MKRTGPADTGQHSCLLQQMCTFLLKVSATTGSLHLSIAGKSPLLPFHYSALEISSLSCFLSWKLKYVFVQKNSSQDCYSHIKDFHLF